MFPDKKMLQKSTGCPVEVFDERGDGRGVCARERLRSAAGGKRHGDELLRGERNHRLFERSNIRKVGSLLSFEICLLCACHAHIMTE